MVKTGSKKEVSDQFAEVGKLSKRTNNAIVKITDYKLSRYICYLIVQNANSKKCMIALGQTYKKGNNFLNIVDKNAGVKNFDKFHNFGYRRLYNGKLVKSLKKLENNNKNKINICKKM